MYRFNISAPGKVSLYGDSIKGSNKTSVAASLNMRTKLLFASIFPRMIPKECIQLDFSSINLHMKIPLDSFLRYFFYENFNRQRPVFEIYNQVKRYVQLLSGCSGNYDPSDLRHRLSLEAFFSLLIVIAYEQNINITSSFIVNVSTELSFGHGLASSSSFVVCLAACFWRWSLLQNGIARFEFLRNDLEKIAIYAGYCDEKIYNNTMCPIDIFVIVKGGIIVYENNAVLKMYQRFPSIKILLVYSKVNKNIDINRKGLKVCRKSILDSISNLSRTSINVFEKIKNSLTNKGNISASELDNFPMTYYDELAELVRMNQELLKILNVPYGNVDFICAIAQEYFLQGKMTNSIGEYILILLPPDIAVDHLDKLINVLSDHGFLAVTTTLCGKWAGVGIE
ncbi:mevalonate kinase-like [Pogonomyrmex barbatus]|uniref:Mevalonate kinase-like n=1 Tax=Pogonomyrmex barbatus TaxID=144034 RepID=A0A6I9WIM7_9HYME|nr:mevalonate kinase-like [Pogonomyrmex barbatus]XP_011642585.1 mevalonate kinase-like [Pogonomyrmex barbatus]